MTEDNNNSRDRSKNMYHDTSPTIEIDYDEELASLTQRRLKSHVVNINGNDIESTLDSGSDCPIITYEKAKELGLEIDKSLLNITNRAVSDIVEQVSGKKIWISLRQLLEIVKPAIKQDIINSIVKQGISRRIPCKAIRKCKVTNTTILSDPSSSSASESCSDYSSIDENEIRMQVLETK
ncbi:hypothetical protein Glove_80g21 [Diversispora epigaea]|uniref:Uncharacterized protein n=1 Tax=Diversispora epigaea TaxID=1348612 RepID=A0A397JH86_9GLOM|nr:hypothetical protein Glove_80g21 [Diversispora epigaea]